MIALELSGTALPVNGPAVTTSRAGSFRPPAGARAGAARRDGRPKLLTGSSDITALHEAFRAHLDVPTLFCPMAGNNAFRDSEPIRDDVEVNGPRRGRPPRCWPSGCRRCQSLAKPSAAP